MKIVKIPTLKIVKFIAKLAAFIGLSFSCFVAAIVVVYAAVKAPEAGAGYPKHDQWFYWHETIDGKFMLVSSNMPNRYEIDGITCDRTREYDDNSGEYIMQLCKAD